jgi:3-hydroxyisobutyrate dehydrogenase-like beta-hydroxyacid dehydrogenase
VSARRTVAVIGLGQMGGPLPGHLIGAGHDVRVHDVDPDAVARCVGAGATAASSPAEAAQDADLVAVVVVDDAQVLDVVTGPSGVLQALAPGAIVTIHSTVTLETIFAVAERAAAVGVTVLDAGVSGGATGARDGTLFTMVGGPSHAVERVRPLLETFSKEVLHAGPLGAGMALKLARNTAFYIAMTAVHEAMELAHRSGIDMAVLRHTLIETATLDQAMAPFDLGGPEPLPDDAPAETRRALEHTNRIAAKDLDQALALAARTGAPIPVIEVVRGNFHRAARL